MTASDVNSVTVTVYPPDSTTSDPGQVTVGYYTVDDNLLTMTDVEGLPVFKPTGQPFEYKLGPGENARTRAGLLTREVRRALRGETDAQEAFRRPIKYGKASVA